MDVYTLFLEYMRLSHRIDEFYHELAQRQGLSDSAFAVLWSILELGEGCGQKDVCRQFCMTKQTVNSSVRKLAAEGILTLQEGAGREMRIYLTDRGRALAQERVVPAMEAERRAAEAVTEEEWRTLMRLGERWIARFQAETARIPALKHGKEAIRPYGNSSL